MAFSDTHAEGAAKGPDVHLSLPGSPLWGQRHNLWRSLPGSPGGSEGSVVKDNEVCWRGKGARDRDIEAGTSNDREGEACMLQKPQRGKSQYSDQIGNHPDDKVLTQPESHSGTNEGIGAVCEPTEGVAAMRISSLMQADSHGGTNGVNLQALDDSLVQRGSLMTAERELTDADLQALEEERRHALKFSYFAAGISGAGIISIYSGYLGNQTGHLHCVHLKICTFFMLATFVSAASMVLLTFLYPSIRVSIHIFKSLKYTTLVCLSLAALYVSYLFLKVLAVIAFVPTIIILLIAFFMVIYKNRPSHSSHEIGGSNPQSFYRL